jgi:hypothetical protein
LTTVGGLAALVNRSISAADAIGKTADKIGVGVEALQELRFAAKASGVEQQTLDMALQRFVRRTAEAAQGTGEAKDALAQMGITLRDQDGHLRRSEDPLADVADAFARIEDPAERVRLAFKLFDSEGVALVNLLSDGSGALDPMRERARDLGIVLDEHLVRDAPSGLAPAGRGRAPARGRPRRLDPTGADQRGEPAVRPAAGRRAMSARQAKRSGRVKPHKVRGRELEEVREKDPDGQIVMHHRTVDTLGKMLRAGTITLAMHDAGKDFQAAFILANLDPLRAIPILRVPGTGREPELNERQLDARRRVHQSLEALGGLSSPAGSCVWHVVGLQRSVREWAIRQGWGGRPVDQTEARGILVAALGMLAGHFGHQDGRRSS